MNKFAIVVVALLVAVAVAQTSCGNGYSCPSGDTCCPNGSGGYGCCPVEGATCCSDHIHCCPPTYPVCDVSAGECKKGNALGASIPWLTKGVAAQA